MYQLLLIIFCLKRDQDSVSGWLTVVIFIHFNDFLVLQYHFISNSCAKETSR